MVLDGKCKICGKPLKLQVDPGYVAFGDPYNLLPKATCNRCYDLRELRRAAVVCLERIVAELRHTKKNDQKKLDKHRRQLKFWLGKYAEAITAQLRSEIVMPVDEIVEALMDHPEKINDIISHFSRAITEEVRSKRKPAELAI